MIWLLEQPEAISAREARTWLPLLDAQRREKALRIRLESKQTACILAGLLLRYAYRQEYGRLPGLTVTKTGKPVPLDDDAPRFNLSHCSCAIACAISREPVGVDVQPITAYDAKFRRILSARERDWIEQADSDRRFTVIWTRKEAYGKALGCGIAYDMAATDLLATDAAPIQLDGRLLWTQDCGGYALSVCAAGPLALRTVSADALREDTRNGGKP